MSNTMRTDDVEHLLDALVALDDPDEVYDFLVDVCTIRELQDMSQRLVVAHMLDKGTSYIDIQKDTGASATTISRVSKALNYGADGYANVLKKITFDD